MKTIIPKSVLNVEVSCFQSYRETVPTTTNLFTFITSIGFKDRVDQIRAIEEKAKRDVLKGFLPAATPSGVFSRRAANSLVKHSRLLQFDIDFKDNQHITNYGTLKEQLRNINNIAYLGLSVSGTGYWGLVPIAYPEKHKDHFLALQKAFKQMGINIDSSCKDVCRLRGYSYDDDAYFNHEAKTFYEVAQPERSVYSGLHKKHIRTDDATKVEKCLSQIERLEIDITGSYEVWFAIGCSLANAFKEDGLDYYQRVSQFHPSYDEDDTEDKFNECLKGYGYTLGTFFHYCALFNLYA